MRAVILTKSAMQKHGRKGACTTALDLSCNRIVRFVSYTDGSPIPYETAENYSLLDIVEVKVGRQCPINPQTENVLVDYRSIRVVGHFKYGIEKIYELYNLNRNRTDLLFMSNTSYALSSVDQYHHSLEIIRVSDLKFYINKKPGGYRSEKATFTYNNITHSNYSVTDPNYDIRKENIDEKYVGNAFIIISIPTEDFNGYGYFKFIAAVYPIKEKKVEEIIAKQNYYEILEVSEKSSIDVIKGAYKALTRKYHPDISKDPHSSEKMKRINLAYEVLSDPSRRAEYDRQLNSRGYGFNNSSAKNTTKKTHAEEEENTRRRQAEEEKQRREEYARRAEEARRRERARREAEEEYYRKQREEIERRAAEARKRENEAIERERARIRAEEEQYRKEAELKARKLREENERRKRKRRFILIILIISAIVFFYKINQTASYKTPTTSKPVSGTTDKKNPNRPANGTIITNRYPEGPIDLTVENYSDNDYYVRLIDKNNIEAMSFYIYGDSKIRIKAPVGTYSVVYSTGKTWFDENKLFGDSTKTTVAKEKSSLPYSEPKQTIRLY